MLTRWPRVFLFSSMLASEPSNLVLILVTSSSAFSARKFKLIISSESLSLNDFTRGTYDFVGIADGLNDAKASAL